MRVSIHFGASSSAMPRGHRFAMLRSLRDLGSHSCEVTVTLLFLRRTLLLENGDMGPPINFRVSSRWRASGPLEVSRKSLGSKTFYTVLKETFFFILHET